MNDSNPTVTNMPTYEVGQEVDWDENYDTPYFRKVHAEKFGPGPFVLVGVEDVPPLECTCGGLSGEESGFLLSDHDVDCGLVQGNTVGHPQWVFITGPDGEPKCFSGAWFKPHLT